MPYIDTDIDGKNIDPGSGSSFGNGSGCGTAKGWGTAQFYCTIGSGSILNGHPDVGDDIVTTLDGRGDCWFDGVHESYGLS